MIKTNEVWFKEEKETLLNLQIERKKENRDRKSSVVSTTRLKEGIQYLK